MNITMRGHDFDANTIEEIVQKSAKYGIYGVQLAMPKSLSEYKDGAFTPAYAERIKDTFAKSNIKIPVLGCYINPSCTDEKVLKAQMDRFKEHLKYARFTGAHMVGTETGYVGDSCNADDNHTEQAYQHLLTNLRELVAYAEKLGVMIGIEGVKIFVINTPQKMRRLLDDLNSPNVLAIFDPINFLGADNYTEQDKIIDDAFNLYGNEMSVLHLKDFIIDENGVMKQVPPTEGMLHTEKIFKIIKQRKPDMPIVLEGTPEKDMPRVMANVKKLFDSIEA